MGQFHYSKDNAGIVTLSMDMSGAVNAMNAEFIVLMQEALGKLQAETELTGVVIASAKTTFFAGGDLHYMSGIKQGQEAEAYTFLQNIKHQLRQLEQLSVPVVAAINGAALGGGFELCLACHHRIAAPNAVVGLPEVQLGLLPGGGGIVRSVNLLGVQTALPLLLEGKKQSAKSAHKLGLIDELIAIEATKQNQDEVNQALVEQAKAWLKENADKPLAAVQPWDLDKKRHGQVHRIPGGDINHPKNALFITGASAQTFQKTRGLLPAPEQIIDMVAEAARLPFDRALVVESRKLAHLITTPQAKNMMQAFFFQMNTVKQGTSRPDIATRFNVKKLGIVGAGMMGQGIAYAAAKSGIQCVLMDNSLEKTEAGKAYSQRAMQKGVERGKVSVEEMSELLARITTTENAADFADCDLVIEAVFEDKALKQRITQQIQPRLSKEAVWGSNTSTLPIGLLAQASDRPENFIGIHFFSPADKMPLVELICSDNSSDETLAKAFDFVQQLGKTPIVVKDKVGFYTSRTFEAQLTEASQLIAEGVHPVKVDNLGVAIGMPVGPLTMMDEVSLKLLSHIRDTQISLGLRQAENEAMPDAWKVNAFVSEHHARGGKHYGGGFYDYTDQGKRIWQGVVQEYYNASVAIPDQDIKDRLLFRNVIEALKCLQEGVVSSVADANIGAILGIGAPVWTGGYIQFVNTYGLGRFIERCQQLAHAYGNRFQVPDIVLQYHQEEREFL
ncbi:3-hydroxyacyl-CoA dehydrogenase NAD-binding domain-containing protein [Alteromonas sp. a30]|uniref:3-hydroxyacyl-CoA dehydrogenase NAD-binding domain-containing protein n=1 Tax=Alteromonas sp. a30 TaxID=2730917 RepID=UPI00227F40F5|nr:3-hydroxyacyl-CoA dehydrogenase NAD-binding domain-containing protein [Alteromonas sp. a30]MCY7295533.1 3-hydroxyacyl-CoA dehydrogenase [Alteromonas sp. a30]